MLLEQNPNDGVREAVIRDGNCLKRTTGCLEVEIMITGRRNSTGKREDCHLKGNWNLDLKKLSRMQPREKETQRHWSHGSAGGPLSLGPTDGR